MKKMFLILLLSISLNGISQSLMLSKSRFEVKYRMSLNQDYRLMVRGKHYLEYTSGDTIVKYYFRNGVCKEIFKTIPYDRVNEYIYTNKRRYNWETIGMGVWIYNQKNNKSPVLIKMSSFGTFHYKLEFDYQ